MMDRLKAIGELVSSTFLATLVVVGAGFVAGAFCKLVVTSWHLGWQLITKITP